MIKITVSITEQQHTWLYETAAKLGISTAEYIRRVLDKERQA